MIEQTQEQHTADWYRARLGHITGSEVGNIINAGRGTDFTQTGYTYLYRVASERELSERVLADDDFLWAYIDDTHATTWAMQRGSENEEKARALYKKQTGSTLRETGSCRHPEIEGFASSPDGLVDDDGCLEIKCPTPAKYEQYRAEIYDAETLRKVMPVYFWQCVSHMAVTGRVWCDFVCYSLYHREPLHIVRIEREMMAEAKLLERVRSALKAVDEIVGKSLGRYKLNY